MSSGDLQSLIGDDKDYPKDSLSSGLRTVLQGRLLVVGTGVTVSGTHGDMKTEQHSWVLTGF